MSRSSDPAEPPSEYPSVVRRLRRSGLAGIAGALIEAGAPLSPMIGQLLYIAQPTLGLFVPRASIARWAEWLEQPQNLDIFAQQLADPSGSQDDPP